MTGAAKRQRQSAPTDFPAAPLERGLRLQTLLTVVLLFGLLAWNPSGRADVGSRLPLVVVGTTMLATAWGFAPAAYRVEPGRLRVRRRLFGQRSFAVSDARRRPPQFGLGVITAINVFASYGPSWRKGVGRHSVYITDRGRLVAVTTDRGLVVVSPAEPERFVRAVRKAVR